MRIKFFTISSIILASTQSVLVHSTELKNPKGMELTPFLKGEDSYRLVLELGIPRRFASRYNAETRTLEIRVIPARSDEFDMTKYYDSRFIKRVIVNANNSEVVLSLQLKNFPMGWILSSQDQPWRIIVDIWKTTPELKSLDSQWNWQPKFISGSVKENEEIGIPAGTASMYGTINPSNTALNKSKNVQNQQQIIDNNKIFSSVQNHIKEKSDKIPEIYGRLEVVAKLSEIKQEELSKEFGENFGHSQEFLSAKKFAISLFKDGQENKALNIFRRLAATSEYNFKKDDTLLWYAGESAFLTANFDLANDYLKSLVLLHPGSLLIPLARLRIIDIDELSYQKKALDVVTSSKNSQLYSQMAMNDKNSDIVKIAATLRILSGIIESNPNIVKTYQQSIDTCVKLNTVPFDLRKNCAYNQVRYSTENDNINAADAAVQYYRKLVPLDERGKKLELIVQDRVKELLTETAKNKSWDTWINFEKSARPLLLQFSFTNADFLFTRAKALEFAGENRKAVQLYEAYLKTSTDVNQKNEACAKAALLLYKSNDSSIADDFLNKIERDVYRKSNGLSENTDIALQELSINPYRNKVALKILLDEIKLGRYIERNLFTLAEWTEMMRGSPQVESIYEKILAYPAKSADEIQTVETSIIRYADYLRDAGKFAKSGDMFFAIANLVDGSKHAEAAYKAGVVYARAGLFEKARTAWLLAANDTRDKRFSALANERLDRLNK